MAQNEQRRSQPDASFSGATGASSRRRRSTVGPPAWPGMPTSTLAAGRDTGVIGSNARRSCGVWRVERTTGEHVVEPLVDVGVVVEAEHDVGLGQLCGQLGAVPLGQAADRDHLAGGDRVGGGQQGVDGVLLRRVDEAAGVDDGDVGDVSESVISQPAAPAGRRAPRSRPRCARSPASPGDRSGAQASPAEPTGRQARGRPISISPAPACGVDPDRAQIDDVRLGRRGADVDVVHHQTRGRRVAEPQRDLVRVVEGLAVAGALGHLGRSPRRSRRRRAPSTWLS